MCIACITGLISAGSSLTAAKGATTLLDRRPNRPARRWVKVAVVVTAIVGAGLLPMSVAGSSAQHGSASHAVAVTP